MLPFWVISFFICHTFPIKSLYTQFKESFQLGTSFYDDFTRLHKRLIAPINTVVVENTKDLALSKQATGRAKFKLKWLWRMFFFQDIFATMFEFKSLDCEVDFDLPDHIKNRLEALDEDTMKTERFFIYVLAWSKFCASEHGKISWKSHEHGADFFFHRHSGAFKDFVYKEATNFCLMISFRQFMSKDWCDEGLLQIMSTFYLEAWEENFKGRKEKGAKRQKRRGINYNPPFIGRPATPPVEMNLKTETEEPDNTIFTSEYIDERAKLEVTETDTIEDVKRKYDEFKQLAEGEMERIGKIPKMDDTIPSPSKMADC